MELLLNLLWLMLALPALLIWRHDRSSGRNLSGSYRSRSFLLLGCLLALLFPVVSATDDLHALRPEIEEAISTKRIVKQFSVHRALLLQGGDGTPARLSTVMLFGPEPTISGLVSPYHPRFLEIAITHRAGDRAPPALRLL